MFDGLNTCTVSLSRGENHPRSVSVASQGQGQVPFGFDIPPTFTTKLVGHLRLCVLRTCTQPLTPHAGNGQISRREETPTLLAGSHQLVPHPTAMIPLVKECMLHFRTGTQLVAVTVVLENKQLGAVRSKKKVVELLTGWLKRVLTDWNMLVSWFVGNVDKLHVSGR